MPAPRSWDLFCHVVDNLGDAAVCWRLAQALVAHADAERERGDVRLWIDDLAALHALQPEVAVDKPGQALAGVRVCHWVEGADFGAPADVAVDAFGCGLPEGYARAMAARTPKPLWIVLEYLSAEPWVATHHGLPSPHPRLALDRYFFFPGFGAGTGGLLRESGLSERRAAFLEDSGGVLALWGECGFALPEADSTVVTLFGYENPAAAELLHAWSCGARPVVAAVPHSRLSAEVAAWLGAAEPHEGLSVHQGALEVRFLPFLAQDAYDRLLWASDWNFVRGEDSFVRAQWAERPFVWQIYPQRDAAHLVKLEAFLDRYCEDAGLAPDLASPFRLLWRGWNDPSGVAQGRVQRAWAALRDRSGPLRAHARRWAQRATAVGDLAANLAAFCQERLK